MPKMYIPLVTPIQSFAPLKWRPNFEISPSLPFWPLIMFSRVQSRDPRFLGITLDSGGKRQQRRSIVPFVPIDQQIISLHRAADITGIA